MTQPTPSTMLTKEQRRKQTLWALAAFGLMFGGISVAMGLQDRNRRDVTAGEARRIPLAQLATADIPDNTYVELTNLRFGDQYWLETDRNSGAWKDAWAFLFSEKDPKTPIAAAHLKDGGQTGIEGAMAQNKAVGLLEKRPSFFTSFNGKKLYELYPKVKSRNAVYFLEVVGARPTEGSVAYSLYMGIGLLVFGVICVVIAMMSGNRRINTSGAQRGHH